MFNDEYSIPGYFVEAVNNKGEIVPWREVHAPFRSILDPAAGYDTAVSFSYDLRYLFWGIYLVSHHLAKAIQQITNNTLPTKFSDTGNLDAQVIQIANKISALPFRFYDDELRQKDVAGINLSFHADETKYNHREE